MPIHTTRFYAPQLASFVLIALMLAGAQAKPDRQNPDRQNKDQQSAAASGADCSGMYSFLRDGEFVQVTVEDHGNVIGFVSRYADQESDSRGEEAYYALKGTLVENTTDEAKKTSSRSYEVVLNSFPQDLAAPQAGKK
jgi:hypothetical protein